MMEDQIFFIYDHSIVQSEQENVADGILYYSSTTLEGSFIADIPNEPRCLSDLKNPSLLPVRETTEEERCMMCGPLIAMYQVIKSRFGSPVSSFCLQSVRVVVKHVDHYTLGLSGDIKNPESLIRRLLDALYGLFRFYHGGLRQFKEECNSNGKDFNDELTMATDCYLAYVRRYGDIVASNFQMLPRIQMPKDPMMEIYLSSLYLLEDCIEQMPGARAGSFFYSERVCCTQLSAELTSRFGILRPKQEHLAFHPLTTDTDLQSVRVFRVFLTSNEYESIIKSSLSILGDPSSCSDSDHSTENEARLCEMELLVQGSSDSLFLLLMDKGSSLHICDFRPLWGRVLKHIDETERRIYSSSDLDDRKIFNNFRFLSFNESTRLLDGNMMQPVMSSEHRFCQTVQSLRADLRDPDIQEVCVRDDESFYAGIKDGQESLYYWPLTSSATPFDGLSSDCATFEQIVKELKISDRL